MRKHGDDWSPMPDFREPDDRWTGYHDPVTGVRLPYNRPKPRPPHTHPDAPGGFDSRCGLCVHLRSLRSRDR